MMIHKLHIEQFGKLKGLELSFQTGIHLIEGENEAGKSTLLRFFLWIFYGPVSVKELNLNLRDFAVPHEQSYAFGRLEISFDNTYLILERRTGRTRKEDFLRILEKDTQNQVYYEDPIGKSIFGLSLHEFIKTLFMGSEQIPVFNTKNDGLFLKLSNLMDSGEEEVSFKKAVEEIDGQIKALKSPKTGGQIPKLQTEIRSLLLELESSKRMYMEKENVLHELETLDVEIRSLENKAELLHELKQKAILFQRKSDIIKLKTALDALNDVISEKETKWVQLPPDESEQIRSKIDALHSAEEELQTMLTELQQTVRELDRYPSYIDDTNLLSELTSEVWLKLISEEQEERILDEELLRLHAIQGVDHPFGTRKEEILVLLKKYERQLRHLRPTHIQFRSILSLLALVSALLLLQPSWIYVGAFLFLIPGLLYYLPPVQRRLRMHHLKQAKKTEGALERISHELGLHPHDVLKSKRLLITKENPMEFENLSKKKEAILERRTYYFRITGTSSLQELAEEMEILRKNIELHRERLTREIVLKESIRFQRDKILLLESDLSHHLLPLGFQEEMDTIDDFWEGYELNMVRKAHLQEKEAQLQLSIKGLLGDLPLEKAIEELSIFEQLSLHEDINEDLLLEKEKQLDAERSEKNIRRKELSDIYEGLQFRDPYFLEDYLNSKYTEEHILHQRLSVLLKTREILMEAEEQLKKQYVETLGDEVTRKFQYITGVKRTILVEDLHAMKFEEGSHMLDDQKLSRGAMSQLYLSLRLTLVQKIFGHNTVPLFMDEVFSSFDDIRTENTLKLLHNEFKEHQILIFTSHTRERSMLGKRAMYLTLQPE